MDDLSDHLLPDIDEPIAMADEDALLAALAALHPRYWESDVLRLPWLAAPAVRFALLGPQAATEEARRPSPDAFFDDVRRGWEMAFSRLPPHVKDLLARPASALAAARRSSMDAAARRRQGRQLRPVAGQTGSRIRLAVARRRTGHPGPRLVCGRQRRSARPPQGARHRALPRPPRVPSDASTFEPALGAYGVCRRPVWHADAAVGKGAHPGGVRLAARFRGVELVGHPAQAPRVIIRSGEHQPANNRNGGAMCCWLTMH